MSEATPVLASTPSSQAGAVAAPVVEAAPDERSFEEKVRVLVDVIEEGHKLGARELSAAVDAVKSHL